MRTDPRARVFTSATAMRNCIRVTIYTGCLRKLRGNCRPSTLSIPSYILRTLMFVQFSLNFINFYIRLREIVCALCSREMCRGLTSGLNIIVRVPVLEALINSRLVFYSPFELRYPATCYPAPLSRLCCTSRTRNISKPSSNRRKLLKSQRCARRKRAIKWSELGDVD